MLSAVNLPYSLPTKAVSVRIADKIPTISMGSMGPLYLEETAVVSGAGIEPATLAL